MFVRRFIFSFVFAILIVALLLGSGYAIYQAGVSAGTVQVYLASQSAPVNSDKITPNSPSVPSLPGWPSGYGYPHFTPFFPLLGFFGVLFVMGLFLLPIFGILRFLAFRGMMHRMAGAGWDSDQEGKWPKHFGPWMWHRPMTQKREPKPADERKGSDPQTK